MGTPFYVWTWDLIDFEGDAMRRAWMEQAMQIHANPAPSPHHLLSMP